MNFGITIAVTPVVLHQDVHVLNAIKSVVSLHREVTTVTVVTHAVTDVAVAESICQSKGWPSCFRITFYLFIGDKSINI